MIITTIEDTKIYINPKKVAYAIETVHNNIKVIKIMYKKDFGVYVKYDMNILKTLEDEYMWSEYGAKYVNPSI